MIFILSSTLAFYETSELRKLACQIRDDQDLLPDSVRRIITSLDLPLDTLYLVSKPDLQTTTIGRIMIHAFIDRWRQYLIAALTLSPQKYVRLFGDQVNLFAVSVD